MKKLLAIMLVLLISVSVFVGCSSDEDKSTSNSSDEDEVIVIQAGYGNNPGEPVDLAMNKWAELLEEKSNGKMKMEIFPSSQLGNKNDLIDQMVAGSPIITLADGAFYADLGVEDFGIVFGPYLFDTWEDAWNLTESDWYAEQSEKLEGKGIKILSSNWKYGDRHTLVDKPISSVDDLKGMKIRVPNNIIQVKGFEVLGATPTPMALGEVYTSLQQGTIDGLENPLSVLYNGKFHEVAKYLALDGHVKNFTTWITGADFFDGLTEEQQQILIETGNEAGLYNNEIQDEDFKETLQKMKDEGVEVVDIDVEEFKEKAEKFYSLPELTEKWSDGLYETVKEAMKE